MYYVEWCSKTTTRSGNMVPLDKLKKMVKNLDDTGFRSHYLFAETYAKEIQDKGHSKGFSQYPVASDRLIIDLDDGDDSIDQVEEILQERGYKYTVWESGGKGYHVCLFHDMVEDINLPWSHRRFVEELGIKCDITLYQHGRIVSLPGRVHPKTGKRKELIKRVDGDLVTIPIIQPPSRPMFDFQGISEKEEVVGAFLKASDMAVKQPYVGGRHTKMWGVSKDLRRLGFSFEWIVELMSKINEFWDDQKSEAEIVAAVEQAFKEEA